MLEMIDGQPQTYQPGVCNIGPAEIRRRGQVGWLGLAATVAVGAALLLLDAPTALRLLIALPAAASLSGFLQARARFCAGFGLAGLQNFDAIGAQRRVTDEEARAADRRKALRINAAAMAGGLLIALAFVALPG